MDEAPQSHATFPPPNSWRYRIEGAQKFVFSDGGRHNPPQILAVYSVKDDTPSHPPTARPQALIERHFSRFLVPSALIRLSPEYLAQLAEIARPVRPSYRIARLTAEYPYASLHPDAAFHFGSSTILVELKPKYAHLSRSRLVPPRQATVLRKYTTPTYHLKNYLIRGEGLPKVPYNPRDLLSRDFTRVKAAIETLRDQKSRSLRVFEHGMQKDPAEHETALHAAAHALVADDHCSQAVLDAQGYDTIDHAGAEILLHRLTDLVGQPQAIALVHEHLYVTSEDDPVSYKLCYASSKEAAALHDMNAYKAALDATKELSADQCARLLSRYMQVSASKDCSLLIALCPTAEAQNCEGTKIMTSGGEWIFRIWIVDVGEKSVLKILKKWAPLDRQWTKLLENSSACR